MKLVIKDLCVKTKEKEILKNFNLEINSSEIHAIMGPNGTGKSTLSKVLMGDSDYIVTSGDILLDDKSILNLETYERARLGLFLVYQSPVNIEGISNSEFIKTAYNSINDKKIGLYDFIKQMESNLNNLIHKFNLNILCFLPYYFKQ